MKVVQISPRTQWRTRRASVRCASATPMPARQIQVHDQKAEKLVGKELVRRFFDLTYNQLRFDEAMGYFEPAGTWEDFSFGKHFGKAAVRSMLGELGSGFPKSLQAEILVITGDNEHVALKYQFTWDGMPLDGASVLSMVKLSQDGTMIESWTDAPEHFAKVGEPVIMGMRPLLQGFDSFRQNLPPGLVDSLPDDMAKWLRRK